MVFDRSLIDTALENYKFVESWIVDRGAACLGDDPPAAVDLNQSRVRARARRQEQMVWVEALERWYCTHGDRVWYVRGDGRAGVAVDLPAADGAGKAPPTATPAMASAAGSTTQVAAERHASIVDVRGGGGGLIVASTRGDIYHLLLDPSRESTCGALRLLLPAALWVADPDRSYAPSVLAAGWMRTPVHEAAPSPSPSPLVIATAHSTSTKTDGKWKVAYHTTLHALQVDPVVLHTPASDAGAAAGIDPNTMVREVLVIDSDAAPCTDVAVDPASHSVCLFAPRETAGEDTADDAGAPPPATDAMVYKVTSSTDEGLSWNAPELMEVESLAPLAIDAHSRTFAMAFDVDVALCRWGSDSGDDADMHENNEGNDAKAAPLKHFAQGPGLQLIASSRPKLTQVTFSRPACRYTFLLEPAGFTVFSRTKAGVTHGVQCHRDIPGLRTLVAVETDDGCAVAALTATGVQLYAVKPPCVPEENAGSPLAAMDPQEVHRIMAALSAGGEW